MPKGGKGRARVGGGGSGKAKGGSPKPAERKRIPRNVTRDSKGRLKKS